MQTVGTEHVLHPAIRQANVSSALVSSGLVSSGLVSSGLVSSVSVPLTVSSGSVPFVGSPHVPSESSNPSSHEVHFLFWKTEH